MLTSPVFREAQIQPSLFLQPIIPMREDLPFGANALLNMGGPDRSRQNLALFLNGVSISGRMEEVDSWVMSDVVDKLSINKWAHSQGDDAVTNALDNGFINVRLGAQSFTNPRFIDSIAQLVSDAGIGNRICVEIADFPQSQKFQIALAHTLKLQSIGVRLALGGFGAGAMSLAALKHLPVDFIKIDEALVRNIDKNARGQAILEPLVDIARSLNTFVVAEQVESQDEANCLVEMGLHYLHGHYLKAKSHD